MGALSIVLDTSGVEPRSAVAIGLAAVLDRRLASDRVRVTAQLGAVRVESLVEDPRAAAAFVESARAALNAPIDDAAWSVAKRALDASPMRAESAERTLQACLGVATREAALGKEDLESARGKLVGWRSLSFGLVAADPARITDALSSAASWPEGTRHACESAAQTDQLVYVTHELSPARVDVQAWGPPSAVTDWATELANPASALSLKLRASEPSLRTAEISAVTHPGGGCVDVRIDAPSADPALLARTAALVTGELDRSHGESTTPPDPRDAATNAAMTELAHGCTFGKPTAVFGVKAPIDARAKDPIETGPLDAALRTQLDAAVRAWSTPQLDTHRLVEPGQADALVLLASTCGTRVEDQATSGATVTVTNRLSRLAAQSYGVTAEPFVSFDAAGLLVRAHARAGEDAHAFGERLALAAARAFFVDQPATTSDSQAPAPPGLALLAATLAPDHPTYVEPHATSPARLLSQATLDARLSAIRHGPVRAVVLANSDDAQADVMARTLDRYLLRTEGRACAADAHVEAPKPGTYVVNRTGVSEAYLALPLPAECAPASPWLGALLRGDASSLSRALVGVARSSDAHVVDAPTGPFLVIHLDAPASALDAAVAQTRALLARLHDGAITNVDLAAAQRTLDRELATATLDPRVRVTRAWRGEPSKPAPTLEVVQSCARGALRDEALVIVAARSTVAP